MQAIGTLAMWLTVAASSLALALLVDWLCLQALAQVMPRAQRHGHLR